MRTIDFVLIRLLLTASIFIFNGFSYLFAQSADSLAVRKNVKKIFGRSALIYSSGMATLSLAWYDRDRQSFTWFNDSEEWKQMDKAGHFFTTFHLSRALTGSFQKAGMNANNAALAGSLSSFIALSSIELLDGYSPRYGASSSDIGANFIGGMLYFIQRRNGNNPLVYPKFSFHSSGLASRRPEMLGKNFVQQILKDYNGQVYWMSMDMDRLGSFPVWLNLAVGYSATDMIFARDEQNNQVGMIPYRRWFIGIDIDLPDIQTRHRLLKQIFSVVRIIRIPAPALEFSNGSWRISPLGF